MTEYINVDLLLIERVHVKEMKIVTNDGFNSVFKESNEIKYVRVDNKDNTVITLKPKKGQGAQIKRE
jgi:hypothetical protein